MLGASSAFTAEAKDVTRKVAQSVEVAWKKDYQSGIRFFTIGVSTIGSDDLIAGASGVQSAWNQYVYENESTNVLEMDYERSLQMPQGGVSKAAAGVNFSNTSGRYTPRFMGGNSSLFTSVYKPMRPMIINAGFDISGVEEMLPQFVGVTKVPELDVRDKDMSVQATDFLEFLSNRFVDNTSIYTSVRSDQLIETLLQAQGLATSQYSLDYGVNNIRFALLEKGTRLMDVLNKIVQAEYGHLYQDEEGVIRFENRQHWDSSPHTTVQQVIYTADVINSEYPGDDHIINVVEINTDLRAKQQNQTIFSLGTTLLMPPGDSTLFVDFEDPILQADTPVYIANSAEDGTGTNKTSFVTLKSSDVFAQAAKYILTNTSNGNVYITSFTVNGRPAKVYSELYYRAGDDSSVTAYEERPLVIDNDYIQDQFWAASLAQLILNDFSDPENLQTITIRARPQLQLGDLISWQGRYWRIFGIKTQMNPGIGFVQELQLLQRTIQSYFRIGISTIGSGDKIAP